MAKLPLIIIIFGVQETFLIIINVENSCAAQFFEKTVKFFPVMHRQTKFKRSGFF